MQKFRYRSPRYEVALQVVFVLKDTTVQGLCTEISKDGMSVEFEQPVPLGSSGSVCIRFEQRNVEVRACVAHAGDGIEGLQFLFESAKDRGSIERLVASLAALTPASGPVLVHKPKH
jgi:hypothetical protein